MLGSPGLPAIAGPSDIIDATSSITRMPREQSMDDTAFDLMPSFINIQDNFI